MYVVGYDSLNSLKCNKKDIQFQRLICQQVAKHKNQESVIVNKQHHKNKIASYTIHTLSIKKYLF